VPLDCPVHQAEQRLPVQRSTATDTCKRYSAQTVRAEVRAAARGAPDSEQYLSGATRRQSSNGQNRPNPNSWVTWLAHRTIRYAHRQQPPQRLFWWLRSINTPQPPPLQPSKHSSLSIQYKSKVQHSKTQIKATDLIKVPNSILVH
jgi:hypothetical protein